MRDLTGRYSLKKERKTSCLEFPNKQSMFMSFGKSRAGAQRGSFEVHVKIGGMHGKGSRLTVSF